MPKRDVPRPTGAELDILSVLWRRGASTVREVYEELQKAKPNVGYTTVLKFMQIMADKGLVRRDESQRAHVYEAQLAEEQTQAQLVGELLARAFQGSAKKLVLQALSAKQASAEELSEIRQMLDELERGER
ncbi:MAG: BlaI/MecI/CopY family transcriptional regulator [Pyrinomonadaceae bacterium]